jgi:hypothetical protein
MIFNQIQSYFWLPEYNTPLSLPLQSVDLSSDGSKWESDIVWTLHPPECWVRRLLQGSGTRMEEVSYLQMYHY